VDLIAAIAAISTPLVSKKTRLKGGLE